MGATRQGGIKEDGDTNERSPTNNNLYVGGHLHEGKTHLQRRSPASNRLRGSYLACPNAGRGGRKPGTSREAHRPSHQAAKSPKQVPEVGLRSIQGDPHLDTRGRNCYPPARPLPERAGSELPAQTADDGNAGANLKGMCTSTPKASPQA